MRLQINQQYAQIGLNIKKADFVLKNTLPKIELKTIRSELSIESPRPELHIDQSQCFADTDSRSPLEFSRHYASLARNAALEGIGRISMEGDMLAQIEQGTTLADVVMMSQEQEWGFNVAAVPQQPPRTWVDTYPVKINFAPGNTDLQLHRGEVINQCRQGQVEGYLAQKNYIEINWNNNDNHVNMTA